MLNVSNLIRVRISVAKAETNVIMAWPGAVCKAVPGNDFPLSRLTPPYCRIAGSVLKLHGSGCDSRHWTHQ